VSSEAILTRFLLGLAAGLAAGAFVVGFVVEPPSSGAVLGAGQAQGTWATPAELAWLERLGRWNHRLGANTTSCSAELAAVGPAPTARLRPALSAFRLACSQFDRGRDGTPLRYRADQMLPPGEVRPLPVVTGDVQISRIEPRFGQIASALARKAVEVRCWSASDWPHLMREERAYTSGLGPGVLGFAGIGGARVNLAPEVCDSLVTLAYRQRRPADELMAAAVVTLSHEAQHSKGVTAEAVAECYAIQVARRTAMKLGARPDYAASLVRTYWRKYDQELPAYRSAECRRGGALDLGFADSIWR
jgi:hypothetical protein